MAVSNASGTTTVRVSSETHVRLRELVAKRGVSMDPVIADAVKAYEEMAFWQEHEASVERMSEERGEYMTEFKAWEDATLVDELEPEEWTDADFITPPTAW
jgi:predicted transcriptional regulator